MKAFSLGLSLTVAAVAVAQPAFAADPAPAAAAATLNGDSPIEAIAAVPAGKTSLQAHFPGLLDHPAYEQFKGMSLRALAPLSGGLITDEKIALLETDMKTVK